MNMLRLTNSLFIVLGCLILTACSSSSELSEITDKEQIEKEIRSCVNFTKSYDTYSCTYHFTSTLKEKYSPEDFRYCVEFGSEGDLEWYAYHEDSSLSSFSIVLHKTSADNWAYFSMYGSSFKILEQKITSGQTLSDEERAFYNKLKKMLNDMLIVDFDSRAYVELNGEKYYLE